MFRAELYLGDECKVSTTNYDLFALRSDADSLANAMDDIDSIVIFEDKKVIDIIQFFSGDVDWEG